VAPTTNKQPTTYLLFNSSKLFAPRSTLFAPSSTLHALRSKLCASGFPIFGSSAFQLFRTSTLQAPSSTALRHFSSSAFQSFVAPSSLLPAPRSLLPAPCSNPQPTTNNKSSAGETQRSDSAANFTGPIKSRIPRLPSIHVSPCVSVAKWLVN
jgi:hypothetical protein